MNSEITDGLIALGVVFLTMLVPIIGILVKHQQKMALIFQGQVAQQNQQTDERVIREIAELRQLVVQQSLAIDNLRRSEVSIPEGGSVQNRLGV